MTTKIKIVWIGKTKSPEIENLTKDYTGRISRYIACEGLAVRDESALLKLCSDSKPAGVLILMEASGRHMSSEEFADWIEPKVSRPLVFAIGPADGFSQEARKAAALTISMGEMTFAHEIARVVLLEQIYRAFTIIKGHPYHLGHAGSTKH